jgi:hypothetical protein
MDNETAPKPSIVTNIYAAGLAGLLLFSTYQIGKLGAESVVVLTEYLEDRKNRKQ